MVFSRDDCFLAIGTGKGDIHIWDIAQEQIVRTLRGHGARVYSICFSPDGKRMLSSSQDMTSLLWDWQLTRPLLRLRNKHFSPLSVDWSGDGSLIASTDSVPVALVHRALPWKNTRENQEFYRKASAMKTPLVTKLVQPDKKAK